MAEIYSWDNTAANNNDTPPDGAPENMNYQEVNDTMREMMAVIARFVNSVNSSVSTAGTQPAYTLTVPQTLSAYANGQIFAFTAHATSTGSVTLNVNMLGAGNVLDSRGNQLGAGDIQQNGRYLVVRTGSAFRVIGHLGGTSIGASVVDTFNAFYTAGGTADALTITTGFSLSALTTGMVFGIIPSAANTGAVTVDIDGIGAVALEDFNSQALVSGDLSNGEGIICYYTGSELRIVAGIPIDLASQVSGVLPIANGGTGQSTASAGFNALKQTATEGATGVLDLATDAEVYAGTDGAHAVTSEKIKDAAAPVNLSDAASISFNWAAGINREVTLGGNRTLANPTNVQPGTWRSILFTQDGTGSRTLSFGANYIFPAGTAPTLSTGAADTDRLLFFARDSSTIEVYVAGLNLN